MAPRLINATLNYQLIVRILGFILMVVGASMLPPVLCAYIYGEQSCLRALLLTSILSIFFGAILAIAIQPEKTKFRTRESYIAVASCWIVASIVGAIPFLMSGFAPTYIDALFEATSGFTTSGCTSINYEIMPHSLMLFKAIANWLGGMGILVFVISILPALGVNGQFIMQAETPGPIFEKKTVRMSDSAKILYGSYIFLSVIEFVLLLLSKEMSPFDALINTMGSISTGGFTADPNGYGVYDSLYVEVIICVFAILASVNFLLYQYAFTGKWKYIIKDVELRCFLIILAVATGICAISLYFSGDVNTVGEGLRTSFFQVVSTSTTCGFAGSDYYVWPVFCQTIIIMLMFIGGCAASTSGSLKVIRVMVLVKLIKRGISKRLHPRSVVAVKIGGKAISPSIASEITNFIILYMGVFLAGSLLLSLQNLSMEATLSSSLAMLSNTGLAFGEIAEAGNYSMFAWPLKLVMALLMIIGRLELYSIIILFTRNFWGKDR